MAQNIIKILKITPILAIYPKFYIELDPTMGEQFNCGPDSNRVGHWLPIGKKQLSLVAFL